MTNPVEIDSQGAADVTIDLNNHKADGTIHFTEASIDHTAIQNIGTTPHPQIDTAVGNSVAHIADLTNPHATTAAQVGAVALTGNEVIDGVKTFTSIPTLPGANPALDNDATRKAYVDAVAMGLDIKISCRAATTAAGTLATDFDDGKVIDTTVTLATGDRILIKDQVAGEENGIYVVQAAGAPTRAADSNTDAEVDAGAFCNILEGTANANKQFVQTVNAPTLGVTALVYTQLSQAPAYTASLGVENVGGDFRLDPLAGGGLGLTGNEAKVNVDNSSIELSGGNVQIKDLGVTNAKLAGSITDAKLNQITTPSKVHGSSLTGLSSTPAGAGILPVANLGSGTPDGTKYLKDNGVFETPIGAIVGSDYNYPTVEFHADGGANATWSNMPLALTDWISSANRKPRNLTGCQQFKLDMYVATIGTATAYVWLQYSINGGTTWFDVEDAGGTTARIQINTTGKKESPWVDVVAGAKQSVLLRLVGQGGDGVLDPAFRFAVVELKYNSSLIKGSDGGAIYEEQVIHAHRTSALAFTNLPAAVAEFTSSRSRFDYNASNASQYKIVCTQAVAGFAGSDLNLQYSVNGGATWAAADTAGAGELDCGTGTGIKGGAWADLVAGAKGDYRWRLVGKGGDGIVDPSFYTLAVQFRQKSSGFPYDGDAEIYNTGVLAPMDPIRYYKIQANDSVGALADFAYSGGAMLDNTAGAEYGAVVVGAALNGALVSQFVALNITPFGANIDFMMLGSGYAAALNISGTNDLADNPGYTMRLTGVSAGSAVALPDGQDGGDAIFLGGGGGNALGGGGGNGGNGGDFYVSAGLYGAGDGAGSNGAMGKVYLGKTTDGGGIYSDVIIGQDIITVDADDSELHINALNLALDTTGHSLYLKDGAATPTIGTWATADLGAMNTAGTYKVLGTDDGGNTVQYSALETIIDNSSATAMEAHYSFILPDPSNPGFHRYVANFFHDQILFNTPAPITGGGLVFPFEIDVTTALPAVIKSTNDTEAPSLAFWAGDNGDTDNYIGQIGGAGANYTIPEVADKLWFHSLRDGMAFSTSGSGHNIDWYLNSIGTTNPTPQFSINDNGADVAHNKFKIFHATVTLDTTDAETAVGLTPGAVILSAAIRVDTQITGLDSADHHIQLGINGTSAKYIDKAQGGASTTIDVNKKDHYTFDPTDGVEASALVLTITGGVDNTPSAGKVEVEVVYLDAADLDDV